MSGPQNRKSSREILFNTFYPSQSSQPPLEVTLGLPKPKPKMKLETESVSIAIQPPSTQSTPLPSPSILSFDSFMSSISPESRTYRALKLAPRPRPRPPLQWNSEFQALKLEAIRKEKIMRERKQAAVLIEKNYRGWKTRVNLHEELEDLRMIRIERKMAEIAVRIRILWAPVVIYRAVKKWMKKRKKEKEKLYLKFIVYSAVFIQKYWRGYIVRKVYNHIFRKIKEAKIKIRALWKGYKTRKIFKSEKFQKVVTGIRDMEKLLQDINPNSNSHSFVLQIKSQLPIMKQKCLKLFYELYSSSSFEEQSNFRFYNFLENSVWVPEISESIRISDPSEWHSKEETPIIPKIIDYDAIAEAYELDEPITPPPLPKFSFLKKGDKIKYNPMESAKRATSALLKRPLISKEEKSNRKNTNFTPLREPVTNATETSFTSTIKPTDTSLGSIGVQEVVYIEEEKKPHVYLKRKSKAMSFEKLTWKKEPRIDCWSKSPEKTPVKSPLEPRGALRRPATKREGIQRKAPMRGSILTSRENLKRVGFGNLDELEAVVNRIESEHMKVGEYLEKRENESLGTEIPLMTSASVMVANFTDEMYEKVVKNLEEYSELFKRNYLSGS